MLRTVTELGGNSNFEERYESLSLSRDVGAETFGFER